MHYRPYEGNKLYTQKCCPSSPEHNHKPGKANCPCGFKDEKQESVLLPKIIASERRNIPRFCTKITLEDIPCCAKPPYRLLCLEQSGAQPWWRPLEDVCGRHRMRVMICIPVCARIQDCCGECWYANGVLEAEVTLGFDLAPCGGWRQQMFINPCLRLLQGEYCSEDKHFRVEVELKVEIYLLKPEPCTVKKHQPSHMEKPLYPQLCHEPLGDHSGCCPPFRPWNH